MPLRSVVDYLNQRLSELHPQAQGRLQAGYRLADGRLSAGLAGFSIASRLVPVLWGATGEPFARRARLSVRTREGLPATPESLYIQAWDTEDVIFLDRFLRTFHALNHLHQGHDGGEMLVLDVHLLHLAAVPERHGQVFEALLHHLGLHPHEVVLRLDARALHGDAHVQRAARSFAGYGYHLLAARPDLERTDWDLLEALGVQWVAPALRDLELWHERRAEAHWGYEAAAHQIGLWQDGIDTPETLQRALTLGCDLIEGGQVLPRAYQPPGRRPLHRPDLAA